MACRAPEDGLRTAHGVAVPDDVFHAGFSEIFSDGFCDGIVHVGKPLQCLFDFPVRAPRHGITTR